jgi:acetylornithine deacetylase/succinyl-diaminopimelate desuccinylase-like protein
MNQIAISVSLLAITLCSNAAEPAKWREYARELLRDSVAYRTFAGEGQVIPFAGFLADQFLQNGFDEGDVHLLPMQSGDEAVATLVVRYKGRSAEKPILFVAHTDVVPAVTSAWTTDPFVLEENDGFFYGRGVIDDKFGTTALTTAFLRLKSQGFVPENDLIVALTGDEETNMDSITTLVSEHLDLIDADFALVVDSGHGLSNAADEPVAAFLQLAEKTYATYVITARNGGGHSSRPRSDNAIYDVADAINAIRNYEFPLRYDKASLDYFANMAPIVGGELGDAMQRFAESPEDEEAVRYLSKDPEYAGKLRTTCVPTMVRGGHVENALPEEAQLMVNCRLYPGVPADEVDARLVEVIANPEIDVLRESTASLVGPSPLRADVVAKVQGVVSQLHPGVPVIPFMSPGTTDGKYLRAAGIDAYGATGLFFREGADRSHGSDERLRVRSFYAGLEFWYLLMRSASSHENSRQLD